MSEYRRKLMLAYIASLNKTNIPIPDCYYDFSLDSNDSETREIIKDYSGNGNDAKAYNIGYTFGSGYGKFAVNYIDFLGNADKWTRTYNTINIKQVSGIGTGSIYSTYVAGTEVKEFVEHLIEVSGQNDENPFYFRYIGEDGTQKQLALKNGVNNIPKSYAIASASSTLYYGFFEPKIDSIGEVNVNIKQLPYDKCLILDGIDDYVALEPFDNGFKTIFMLCNPLESHKLLYDQRLNGGNFKFAIYNGEADRIAYEQRNDGKTYINGVLNTTISTDKLLNKKHLITIINNDLQYSQSPIIGANLNHDMYYINMILYKFLGFKEELTEEQILHIIEKYNLLDGVDEIEVS